MVGSDSRDPQGCETSGNRGGASVVRGSEPRRDEPDRVGFEHEDTVRMNGSLVTLTKPLIDVVEGVSGYALASFSLVVSLIFIDRFQSRVANDKGRDNLK